MRKTIILSILFVFIASVYAQDPGSRDAYENALRNLRYSITPRADNILDLGTAARRFNDAFIANLVVGAAAVDSLTVGGGYGSTGVTISATGNISMNGNLIVDGTASVGLGSTLQGAVIIDVDNAEALLVRQDADAGDIFTVNTTTGAINLGSITEDAGTLTMYEYDAVFGVQTFTIDVGALGVTTIATDTGNININAAGGVVALNSGTYNIEAGSCYTDANRVAMIYNIPVTGVDAGAHTISWQIDSNTFLSGAATGDGAGGVGARIVTIGAAGDTLTLAALSLGYTQSAGATGVPTAFTITGGAHTGLTAATEDIGVNFNFSATKTWAAGAGPLTQQREVIFRAPTYVGNAAGALTITDAATVYIDAGPTAGANMTITRSHAALFADNAYLSWGTGGDAMMAWNTTQTVDGLFLGLAGGQNTFIIAEAGDRAYDFAHGAATNPTLFVHSAVQNTTQWLSLAHNQTDAVISTGAGDLILSPVANNVVVGTSVGNNNLTVLSATDGNASLYFSENTAASVGLTLISGYDFEQNLILTGARSGLQYVFGHASFTGQDFDHIAQTNPTLFIHSAIAPDVNNTQWISLAHNQTNGIIQTGAGVINMGTTAATGHGLVTGDVLFGGATEFDGTSWFDGAASFGAAITFSGSANGALRQGIDDGLRIAPTAADGTVNNNVIITTFANALPDHDHDTASANPTFIVHSNLDPDTSNNQWGSISHNQENFVITTGANVGTGTGATTDNNGVLIAPSNLTSSGTADFALSVTRTLNDAAAAGGADLFNGILLNVIPTNVTGWDTLNLMDLQYNTVSAFRVATTGSVSVVNTSALASIDVNITGTTYTTALGAIDIVRSGNITGVDTETMTDLNINPAFTLTEPGAGQFNLYGANIDLSGISVTAGVGTSLLATLRLVANADADVGTNLALFVDNGNTRFDSYNAMGMGASPTNGIVLFAGANGTTMPAATTAWRHLQTGGNVTELAGAAITDIVGAYFNTFTITDGGAAETVGIVATVYIPNAPTAGTAPTNGPYALYVDAGISRFDGGISTVLSNDNVTNPPTDAELDAAFGDPSILPIGFMGIVDDAGAGTNVWFCYTTGVAGEWFYVAGTQAA